MVVPVEILIFAFAVAVGLASAPGVDNRVAVYDHDRPAYLSDTFRYYTIGLCTPLLVYTVALALVSFAGVAVLRVTCVIYIAWALLQTEIFRLFPPHKSAPGNCTGRLSVLTNPPSNRTVFRWGMAISSGSPKAAIFFLAFLPFADPDNGSLAIQILLLGGALSSATAVVFGFFPHAARYSAMKIQSSVGDEATINRIVTVTIFLLAVRLFVVA